MKTNILSKRLTYAGLALWFALLSCNLLSTSDNQVKTESESVKIKSATAVRVQIEILAGELTVEGGGGNLMDADFQYDVDEWKPLVQYSENGAQGELIVSQPQSVRVPVGGGSINTWKLLLKNDIPMDLSITTHAGNSDLDLSELDLTALKIGTGAGTTNINLGGNWDHDVTASINGGFGELMVKLPDEMGVRIEMETGVVNVHANGLIVADEGYVNKAYGTSPYTLTLKLGAGAGSVVLTVP